MLIIDCSDIFILIINFKNKKIILIYFSLKNIFKNNYHPIMKPIAVRKQSHKWEYLKVLYKVRRLIIKAQPPF
jgi:hypothetical protein